MKLRKPSILVVNWVSSCLSFFLSASIAIFIAPNCTTTILRCSISNWDLLKCLYFEDTTKRRERGERRPKDRVKTVLLYG
jgi:hypothetical protein